jgi:protein O-mannosyl-transferase
MFLAALLGVTFLCYLPALGYSFVYDDRTLLLNNPAFLTWRSVPDFFLKDFTSVAIPVAPAVYYRPVLLIWMLVNTKIWGAHPMGWHFTAIALHLAVTAEVYALARRLLPSRFAAGVAAGVFALHPLHVECVAWIMAEAEQLSAVFLLASLFAYFRTREDPRRKKAWWGLSLGLFTLGLLIKEAVIMLPALIAAYAWFYDDEAGEGAPPAAARWKKRAQAGLQGAAPYLAVVALYLAVRISILKGLGHVNTPMSLSTFLATIPLALFRYVKLLLWPVGLSVCYDVPYVHHLDFRYFFFPLLTVLLFSALLVAWAFRNRARAFAAVWLILPLLPALDFPVFFRSEFVHDRYLYLPSVGFAILVGSVFAWLAARASKPGRRSPWPVAGAAVLLGLLAAGTCYARRFWKDDWTLFHRAVQIAPHNVMALHDLGDQYAARGEYQTALGLYRQVLAEYPAYWESAFNAGYCLYKLGRLEEAEGYFKRAFGSDSEDPEVCIYYGMTSFRLGRLDQAEALVRRAVALRPKGRGYHLALGVIFRQKGDLDQARQEFRAELANYPDEAAAARQIQELEQSGPARDQSR